MGRLTAVDGLVRVTIRCHPRVPVSSDELGGWLDEQVHRLRAAAPRGTVRLSRLTQDLPNVEIGIGWLLELELPDDDPLLTERRLAEVLTDMRLLGLQPTLLTPKALPGNGRTPVERYTTAPMAAGRTAGQDPD